MTPQRIIWLEIARNQYDNLSEPGHAALDLLLLRLAADPNSVAADYDSMSDQWIAPFADGTGLLTFATVPAKGCIIVLRILTFP